MLRLSTVLLVALVVSVPLGMRGFFGVLVAGYVLHVGMTWDRRRARWRRRRLRRRIGSSKRLHGEWRTLLRAAWAAHDDYGAVVRATPDRTLRKRLADGRPMIETGLAEAASIARTAAQLERTLQRQTPGGVNSADVHRVRQRIDEIRRGLQAHVTAMQAASVHAAELAAESAAAESEEFDSSVRRLHDDLAALATATAEVRGQFVLPHEHPPEATLPPPPTERAITPAAVEPPREVRRLGE